jgi:hypothetical protein
MTLERLTENLVMMTIAAVTRLKRMIMRRGVVFASVLPLAGLAHLVVVEPALAQATNQPVPPAPPRVFLDTSYTAPSGRTIVVRAGGDLQAALNTAQPGDVVALEPGGTFRGNFSLPRKPGSGWIIVRSGAPDQALPNPGTRVTPAFAPAMPKILSPNQNPAVYTEPGAHHFRFIGIEFSTVAGVKDIYSIVAFGGDQRSDADTPHDLILDRCYVHGRTELTSRRGVLLNSASSAVIDSYVSEIHAAGYDSQAVLGYNGPGPFKIVNNYLEGAAENVMFGGADPATPGLVPSDIEIRRNHIFKPLSWRPGDPSFAGVHWTVKNLLELKNAQRVLIEGNLLENVWSTALVLTPRNQDGKAPWSVVQDVLFRSNIVKNADSGFSGLTTDDEQHSQPMKRIAIVNNLWHVTRIFFGMTSGRRGVLEDLVIDHNTAIPAGYRTYYFDTSTFPALVRFRLTNNLAGFGSFGVQFEKPEGLATVAPSSVIARNALVNIIDLGDQQGLSRNHRFYINQAMYTSFASPTAAGLNADGTLTMQSPVRRAGTDGQDIGVDFVKLQRALRD